MAKRINAEKVEPLLIYPDNLAFLQRDAKLPHSSNEVMNNLRTRMGGTIAFEQNPLWGIALYSGLLMICAIVWIVMGLSLADYFLNFSGSTGPIPRFKTYGRGMAIFSIFLGGFTWIIAKTLFSAIRYSPAKMKQNYALMLHQGLPIKGTMVSAQAVNGIHVITYRFISPAGKELKCEYRSPRLKYRKGEVVNGKSVIVWYLNDTINTLL
jgi:hypothetical protein